MKCLTICQPWATLIIRGFKRIENRSWPTHHRGPIAIHAGKSRQWLRILHDPAFLAFLRSRGVDPATLHPTRLPFGAVLGVCDMTDCQPFTTAVHGGDPLAVGPYCWRLDNPQPLADPTPSPGTLGLWDWNPTPTSGISPGSDPGSSVGFQTRNPPRVHPRKPNSQRMLFQ